MGTSTTIITAFFVTHKHRFPSTPSTKHSITKKMKFSIVLHYQHHLPNGIMKKSCKKKTTKRKQIILSSSINLCQPDSFNCMCGCMSLVYRKRGWAITSPSSSPSTYKLTVQTTDIKFHFFRTDIRYDTCCVIEDYSLLASKAVQ